MPKRTFRKTLSAPGLLSEVRAGFDRIGDSLASRGLTFTNCLMSGVALFGLKYTPPRCNLTSGGRTS